MKKIVHLSDLHFGTERPGIVEILRKDVQSVRPDIIIVSGDLTQRATHSQYEAAKKFLQDFSNIDVLCVPGNHDISLFNPFERFFYPYNKYKKWINPLLCSAIVKDNIAILGINSATPYKTMSGYITEKQIELVKEFFHPQLEHAFKVIVMHHNLISSERHKIINDSEKLIKIFASCNVNLVLSGHIHFAAIELLKRSHFSHNMYVITAGTAISTRTIQANSYNVIEIHQNDFKLSVRSFDGSQYIASDVESFPL